MKVETKAKKFFDVCRFFILFTFALVFARCECALKQYYEMELTMTDYWAKVSKLVLLILLLPLKCSYICTIIPFFNFNKK